MHDIRFIRDNPADFDMALGKRGLAPLSAEILKLDEARREAEQIEQQAQAKLNAISREIGQAKSKGDDALFNELMERRSLLTDIDSATRSTSANSKVALNDFLATIPNLPAEDVPEGADESANVEISRWGTPRSFDFTPQDHADFGPALGMDFEAASAMSGARFTALRGGMARLHRALAQFMLDRQTGENGYEEVNPPLLVRDATLYGTGQLPKFAEDLFHTTDERWLIPTAEVSLTNLVREQIVHEPTLPLRFTALTPCFRSEAGSAGRDTRGFIRQHQFEKVELVAICRPEESEAEHDRMVKAAEGILETLELPYRKVLLCTGDMGFGARKTFDLEVWLPSQKTYREISSISNCGDFQARRMNARYKPEGEKQTRFLHTLNGSGLAVGRTLVAVLENYQQADGSVLIPEILHPYMGGLKKLDSR